MRNQLLEKLATLLGDSDEIDLKTYEGMSSVCKFNTGSSSKNLADVNSFFDYKIPKDYYEFLTQYDGCCIYKIEDFAGYKIYNCSELIKENRFQKENYGEKWDGNIFLFCSIIGDGEYLGFKIIDDNSYEILDCIGDVFPSHWNVIGNSFNNFFKKLIDVKGEKFWLR